MDPPGSWSGGPNAMMGGGIRIQQQADGSVVINLVPATSPTQNPSVEAAARAPRTAPNAGGADRRRDGASTSGSGGAFKCDVKGCKDKRAKEGFKAEISLVKHILCDHENSEAARRWRREGYKKVRHQKKVTKVTGEPCGRTPTANPSPSTTATVSRSRSAPAAARDSPRAKKKLKTATKDATPSKGTRVGDAARQPLSPSRLFAKSPGQKQQLLSSPINSDDETSSDEDEDSSDSNDAGSGGGGEDGGDASEDDDVEDIVGTEDEALDFEADDAKPESAWEVLGKDESVEATVKIEPMMPAAKEAKRAPDAAASKSGPAEPAVDAKREREAVKPPKPEPVEPAVEIEMKREAEAAAPAASSPPQMSAGSIESSDVEEVEPPAPPAPPAPPPLPPPRDPPTSRHFFATRYSADDSATGASQWDAFTLRVLSRAREAYGEKTRRRASGNDARPRDVSSANVRPARRFADAKEYAAYNAALVLDDAASTAAETVVKKPPKRHVTHWRVHSGSTKEEIRERAEAGAKLSYVVLTRDRDGEPAGGRGSKGPLPPSSSRSGSIPPLLDELVLLWRGGDSPQSHVLGVVKDASDDGGRLCVEVESSELLRAVSSPDALLAHGAKTLVALGHDLKTSRREFDAAHFVPLLIAPLLAPILSGEPFYTRWNKDERSAITGEANIPGTVHGAGTLPLSAGAPPRNLTEVLDAIDRWTAAERFNDAQARAMRLCVCPGDLPHETVRRCAGVALLHGPPGTGKTSTLVGAISALLLCSPAPRVLLCAPSNAAVDELVLRLARGRIKSLEGDGTERGMTEGELIRVGPLDQISTRVSKYALDTLVDKAIDNLNKRRDGSTARAFEEQRERRTILERARVVATTTSAAGAEYLKEYKFDAVVVDEAAQSSEAATLIPLMRRAGHVKRIILAGDHRQLPAVAHARDPASRRAYGTSLFERLVLPRSEGDDGDDDDSRAHPASTLIVQHRMNAEISRFPSAFFYGGRLIDAPTVAQQSAFERDARVVSDGFEIHLSAYAFLDWRGLEETHPGGENDRSYFNRSEAAVVAATVRAALRHARADATVAVVTPYASQKAEIWRLLSRGEDSVVGSGDARVRCNTVDSYQGQEADIVVFSCVRTRALGFLSDERRLNVALTRARESLLIVGSAELLREGPESRAWPSLVADAEARGRLHAVTVAAPGQAEGRLVARDARRELERQIQADDLNAQRRLAAGSKAATRGQSPPPSEETRGAKRRAPNAVSAVSPKRPFSGSRLPVGGDADDPPRDDEKTEPSGRTCKFQPTARPRPEPKARSARTAVPRRVVVGEKRLGPKPARAPREPAPARNGARPARPTRDELIAHERWKERLEKQALALEHEKLEFDRQRRLLGLTDSSPKSPRGERRRGGRGSRRGGRDGRDATPPRGRR